MIACCDQLVHLLVHGNELVLSECLLLFPIDKCLRDLLLEPAGLDCVYHLQFG